MPTGGEKLSPSVTALLCHLPHQREAFFRTPVTPSVIARRPIGPTSKELLERSDLEFGVAQLAISASLGCQMLLHAALSNS